MDALSKVIKLCSLADIFTDNEIIRLIAALMNEYGTDVFLRLFFHQFIKPNSNLICTQLR